MALAALGVLLWAKADAVEVRELRTLLADSCMLAAELETIEAEVDSEAMELD